MNLRNLGTPVEIIDFVTDHLLKQGARAVEESVCRYKLGEMSCAVGCLISPEDYIPLFENKGVKSVLIELKLDVPEEISNLLSRLQFIHDRIDPLFWKGKLSELRKVYESNSLEEAGKCLTPFL